jgi:hypothetical protein
MGWDVMLFPAGTQAFGHLGEYRVLGTRAAVIEIIKQYCPGIQFDKDESFGVYDDGDSQIEFIILDEDPLKTISLELHGVRRAGERLRAICRDTGWEVFDVASGTYPQFDGEHWK